MTTLDSLNELKSIVTSNSTIAKTDRIFIMAHINNLGILENALVDLVFLGDETISVSDYDRLAKRYFTMGVKVLEFDVLKAKEIVANDFKMAPYDPDKYRTERIIYRGEFDQVESIPNAFYLK